MKAAENRSRCDGAEPLNRPMNGSVLAQSPMSSRFIVVGGKLAKDLAQMGLTEHNQVVETFPSDRADQSLRVPIRPRRARSNKFLDGETVLLTRLSEGQHATVLQLPASPRTSEAEEQRRVSVVA
jgi:hypothetical protein